MGEGCKAQGAGRRGAEFGKYVGIPFADHGRDFAGCDCWGLVRLVYRHEFGIELPDLGPLYADTKDLAGKTIVHKSQAPLWAWVDSPRAGDAVLLRVNGAPLHVGVVVDCDRMLHVERGTDAVIERMDSPLWKNRIEGFYRHAGH